MGGGESPDQRCRQVSALCHESSARASYCMYRGVLCGRRGWHVVWKERVACGFVFVFHLASFPGHVLWSEVGFVLLMGSSMNVDSLAYKTKQICK